MFSSSFFRIANIKPLNICNHFCTSKSKKTHYEVLNLPRNCTSKQIKDSFIKLSKENHPDINKNRDAHKKFLAINESYKVLCNAESRRHYDLGLIPDHHTTSSEPHIFTRRTKTGTSSDPFFYANRDKSRDKFYKEKPYYGFKGQQKVSNTKVVSICICLAILVVGLQILAISKSVTFQRGELIKRSDEFEDSLKSLRKKVEENGNEVQLEILKQKFDERNKTKKE